MRPVVEARLFPRSQPARAGSRIVSVSRAHPEKAAGAIPRVSSGSSTRKPTPAARRAPATRASDAGPRARARRPPGEGRSSVR